jgi:serine carboxypeptidase-like clade II
MQPWFPRGYDPCTEKYSRKYYNLPEVQKALHANVTGIPYAWVGCRSVLLVSCFGHNYFN